MDNEKHVDESWKNDVSRQKDATDGCTGSLNSCSEGCECGHEHGEEQALEVSFFNYIMSMGYQAMIFLGEVPNPVSGQVEQNLRQAKFLIDTLALIKEKTRGNLTPEEENILSSSLYELQMKFVQLAKGGLQA